jgi:O-antigen ligase
MGSEINLRYMKSFITVGLASFYVLALILDGAAGVIFALLVLTGLFAIASRQTVSGKSFWQISRQYWPLNLAMAAPLIAVLLHQLARGDFAARSFDLPFRLALFALIFWVVLFVPLKYMRHMQWAFIIGALLSTIKMYVLTDGGKTRYGHDFIPIIIFAEMAMLLGFFAAFSIAWNKRSEKPLIFLKLLTACAVVYGAYISQSRGTWVTIPLFAGIAYAVAKDLQRRYKIVIAAIIVVVGATLFQYGSIVQERIAVAETDIQQYLQGTEVDTSLGIRFQLWRGSWILFKENPVFGVGVEEYPEALEDLAARKIITPTAASFPHSHNEVMFMISRLGIFGLLAILAVYFVPAYYFFRDLRDDDKEVRSVAGMGLVLCFGIMVLGLVDVVFLWWEIFPFYSISIALFLAYIIKRKESALQSATGDLPLTESIRFYRTGTD